MEMSRVRLLSESDGGLEENQMSVSCDWRADCKIEVGKKLMTGSSSLFPAYVAV